MKKKLMTVVGALSLVACGGSGVPWGGEPPDDDGVWGTPIAGTSWGSGGTLAVGGSGVSDGGYETGGTGQGGAVETGGTGQGGAVEIGGTGQGGAVEIGGYGGTGVPYGGTGAVPQGGYTSGGTGSQSELCLQNVVHCFDAAANCYQYSPWSDCDQIVDVCTAMQMDCSE
jgi:hypothetical protein